MKGLTLSLSFVMSLVLPLSDGNAASQVSSALDKVYQDESHCLVLPEIRREQDRSISCYCRDAIVITRYVNETYIGTGKDPNLVGAALTLEMDAGRQCGKEFDTNKATTDPKWRWNGPEVTRTYPPDSKIEEIKADERGFRLVPYLVHLTYRDQQGRIAKVENFTAQERLPLNFRK